MAETILEVCAVDDSIDGSEVMLEVVERSSPFVGLFAWGADLREAGEGLAGLVWADHVGRCGRAGERAEVTGVRILTRTAHTFHAVRHFNAEAAQ